MGDTILPSNLAASMSGLNNTFEHDESSLSLLSRRESSLYESSRYLYFDGNGIYLSSLTVTVLVSAVATIGILLFTIVITLAILLASCHGKPDVVVESSRATERINTCKSVILNFELNNLQNATVLRDCHDYLLHYMKNGQYESDVEGAIMAAEAYWSSVIPNIDGLDAIIMDIDETALSNLPHYASIWQSAISLKSQMHNENTWTQWIHQGEAPALTPTLKLYQNLCFRGFSMVFITSRHENFRNATEKNLLNAGYSGWRKLIMRSDEFMRNVQSYKSEKRMQLKSQGFHIQGVIGDQWSDLLGPFVGSKTFKIPNPLYHTS
eukprot:TRINITY_DN4111_c0_g1_i12.p1 TRINITY_DN4111_c0_g1~~TRINITY_DN4111_c0_g1_i12.p1  ORF type:complete len:323 (+),score=48.21 TRINITY_DN4111_c0_g1_i12:367-1335(+)